MKALEGHGAEQFLKYLAERGAPVVLKSEPWGEQKIENTLKRGPHKSCRDHLEFLRSEILDFVQKGYWVLLPYRLLKEKMKMDGGALRKLRLSPPGVVPQRERRPRLIVDYTFYELNQDTLQLAPEEAMQFARALEQVLYQVRNANPRYGPVYLGKVDLADGFCRVWLIADSIPQLAVTFPKYPGEEQLVGMPLTLPMGWLESVPYFCATTEMVADRANSRPLKEQLLPHPLEKLALTKPKLEIEHEDQPLQEPKRMPIVPIGQTTVAQVERPAIIQITAAVPQRSDGMLDGTVARPTGPDILQPFQKPV